MLHHRACNPHSLPLPTRECIGALVGKVCEANRVEQGERLFDIFRCKFTQPRFECGHIAEATGQNVFHHGQSLDQVKFLKYHADSSPCHSQLSAFELGQIHALK